MPRCDDGIRGYVVSGDLWARFTAELQQLTAEVPGLAHVVAGPDVGDAAGRYRSMCAVLSEIACTASELDDGRVWTWLASDAVAAVRAAGHTVIPLPGPNAAITAVSAAGLEDAHFLFYGFLPSRPAARREVLAQLRPLPFALVFYEAPHRIVESVADIAELLEPQRHLVIGRELTKLFETIACMPLSDAPGWLAADSDRRRGEFVLIVSAPPPANGLSADAERTLRILLADLPVKQAVRLAAQISGGARNLLYDLALELREK